MRSLPFTSLLLLGLLSPNSFAQQAPSAEIEDSAKFVVQVNMDAVRKSELGSRLLSMARDAAAQEISSETGSKEGLDKITEALGFDPLQEIRSLTIVGDDFEEPRPQLILSLGKSTGNLEGMALGLPEYEASEYGDHTIHTANPGDERAFAAIHTDDEGMKKIVAATTISEVKTILDQLDHSKQHQLFHVADSNAFIHMRLLEIPTAELGDGPQQTIAKLLKDLVITIADDDGNFELNVQLTTETKKQAQQIQQMAQGLIAMVSFVQMDEHDEEMQKLQQILQGLKSKRNDTHVHLSVQVPTDDVIQFLREEADLPF